MIVYYQLIMFPCINLIYVLFKYCIHKLLLLLLLLVFIVRIHLYCAYCYYDKFCIHFRGSLEYWMNEFDFSLVSTLSIWTYNNKQLSMDVNMSCIISYIKHIF
jgi:hypothetical protein